MYDHRSTLARRGALAAALALTAIPASAQTAAQTVQVLEINHVPTSSGAALNLRRGLHLLALRGPVGGPFTGTLRGPNNELVAEGFPVTASGCTSGLSGAANLTTAAFAGRANLNQLGLSITVGTGCRLNAALEHLGSTSIVAHIDPEHLPCKQELAAVGAGNQACLEFTAWPSTTSPDLAISTSLSITAQPVAWGKGVVLQASQSSFRAAGRCFFPWSLDVRNVGSANSGPTTLELLIGNKYGLLLDSKAVPGIAAGGALPFDGVIALPPGKWVVFARVDPENQVAESNAGNNYEWFHINVAGNCSP